jgi:UDP-N-acetylmuramyl pentapeptide phosphotransferase/UDP-N-acetylglucosamine-1-phosphate transferase
VNAIIFSSIAAAIAWALIGLYRRAMLSHGRLEAPTERGMHSVPVPSGAGAAIVAAVLVLWPISRQAVLGPQAVLLLGTFAALAALSWVDDRGGLSPAVRLLAHAAAATPPRSASLRTDTIYSSVIRDLRMLPSESEGSLN